MPRDPIRLADAKAWAPLPSPFAFVVLSATPPADTPSEAIFPSAERDRALDHPVLRQRLQASKPTELVGVRAAHEKGADPLVRGARWSS